MGLRRVFRFVALWLAVLLLAGCGSDATKQRREAVNQYIDDVTKAQVNLTGHQGQIDAALAAFSLVKPTAKELAALRRGKAQVDETITRVRFVDVPPDAKKLQRLVLARLKLQSSLLDELIRTGYDARRLIAVTPTLQAAASTLHANLAAISTSSNVPQGGSAGVLERFGEAFGRYGDALRPLPPKLAPAEDASLLGPTLAAQERAVAWSVRLCDGIRADLRRNDVASANLAIHSLLTIAATLNGSAVRLAEARVAKTYDARIDQMTKLEQQIAAERGRLVRTVG